MTYQNFSSDINCEASVIYKYSGSMDMLQYEKKCNVFCGYAAIWKRMQHVLFYYNLFLLKKM